MKILVTGGAGFIGSNLVEALLKDRRVTFVRVLDNLSTGYLKNLEGILDNPNFQFMEGDIRNPEDCNTACEGMDAVSHQAALGSVPRSIADPVTTFNVNVTGFINILEAARKHRIKRINYASSSSVYGDFLESPKVESRVGRVLSPYAASKMSNELYAEAYAKCYDMQILGFRYFNVFGPKQHPDGPYAAVIPRFIKHALDNTSPTINGDGLITRDFTFLSNVLQINEKGLLETPSFIIHEVYNVACGQTTSLNMIWQTIKEICNCTADVVHGPERQGDIKFSLASIDKAQQHIDYIPEFSLEKHLSETIEFYRRLKDQEQGSK